MSAEHLNFAPKFLQTGGFPAPNVVFFEEIFPTV